MLSNPRAFELDTSRLTRLTWDGMTVVRGTSLMLHRTLFTFLWTPKVRSSLTKCQVKTCHFAITCLPLIKSLLLMGCFTVGSCKRSFSVVLLSIIADIPSSHPWLAPAKEKEQYIDKQGVYRKSSQAGTPCRSPVLSQALLLFKCFKGMYTF